MRLLEPRNLAVHLSAEGPDAGAYARTRASIVHAATRAQSAGLVGEWHVLDHAAEGGTSDAELVLLATAGSLVEPDAIAYLVRAAECGVGVVDARVIPIELPQDYARYTGLTQNVAGVLTLFSRSVLTIGAITRESLMAAIASSPAPKVFAPSAVVFRDSQEAPAPAVHETRASIPKYFDRVSESSDPALAHALRALVKSMNAGTSGPGPFLSIIVRVRGTVGPHLADLLLCLEAQNDQDFELLIVTDGSYATAVEAARGLVMRLESGFADRVRVIDATAPRRGARVNQALDHATGSYVAVLDQEDVLLDRWVSVIREVAGRGGALVRTGSAIQQTRLELWPDDKDGHRVISSPVRPVNGFFDHLDHLHVAAEEQSSWAYPRAALDRLGLRFDAELDQAEEWELIHSGVQLLGLRESLDVTRIRRGPLGESAFASGERLALARIAIDRVVDSGALLLQPGVVQRLRTLADRSNVFRNYGFMFSGLELRRPLRVGLAAATPALEIAARVMRRIRSRRS